MCSTLFSSMHGVNKLHDLEYETRCGFACDQKQRPIRARFFRFTLRECILIIITILSSMIITVHARNVRCLFVAWRWVMLTGRRVAVTPPSKVRPMKVGLCYFLHCSLALKREVVRAHAKLVPTPSRSPRSNRCSLGAKVLRSCTAGVSRFYTEALLP